MESLLECSAILEKDVMMKGLERKLTNMEHLLLTKGLRMGWNNTETDIEDTYDIYDEYYEHVMEDEALEYPCNADDALKLFQYLISLEGT
ncbi:hypothetical protein QZH41_020443 [Actinostola sp. cb2023]|nr:hypothetical protein QZH41_020443 [Actinostola sp. cb2023]